MSKSIYGDALAIIDNIYESDTVADFDYYDVRGLPLSWEVDRDELEKIKHALEQAQKQEQLLELYKELVREIKDYMLGNINDIDYSKSVLKVNNLDKQIKELENE